jgi:hypothetical protein
MLVDDFLPVFDVSDAVATVVHASVGRTWRALMDVDLIDVGRKRPLVGALGALRALPDIVSHLLHGEAPAAAPARLRLHDLPALPAARGGWVLLGEVAEDEIALGLVGKFWRPVIEFAEVPPGGFGAFATPGFAKTVYALSVRRLDDQRTLLTGTMRTATTSDDARRWFRRYWTFGVGAGAHVLVQGLLDVTRESAESTVQQP